jgi:hypothetical protein
MPHSELDASQILRKAMRKRFAYDVFLSHNANDKPAVRGLANRLKLAGTGQASQEGGGERRCVST